MFAALLAQITAYNPRSDVGLLYQIKRELEGIPENSEQPYSLLAEGLLVAQQLIVVQADITAIAAAMMIAAFTDQRLPEITITATGHGQILKLLTNVVQMAEFPYKIFNERHAKNFRRLLLTAATDFRAVVLYLAWNVVAFRRRALATAPINVTDPQVNYLRDILIPLCEEVNLALFKRDFENLLLYWLEPVLFARLAVQISERTAGAESFVTSFRNDLRAILTQIGISAEIVGRTKSVASTWFKIHHRVGALDEVFDLIALRVIVERLEQCYDVIAEIHARWPVVPDKYKDYIKNPKKNGYQSIHSTVLGPDARIIEFQVRTFDMHNNAERGAAVHWHYKKLISRGHLAPSSMTAMQKEIEPESSIWVLTPQGEVIDLPEGATGLDFAFRIHSAIGFRAVGLRVNNQMTPLRRVLNTGETVEVITASRERVSDDWLNYVKTRRARTKIERWLAEADERKGFDEGVRWLTKQVKKIGVTLPQMEKSGMLTEILDAMGFHDLRGLASATYRNAKIGERFIAKTNNLMRRAKKSEAVSDGKSSKVEPRAPSSVTEKSKEYVIMIDGKREISPRLSKCCEPTPTTPIFAFITRGKGFTIHTLSCPNASRLQGQPERIRAAAWVRLDPPLPAASR